MSPPPQEALSDLFAARQPLSQLQGERLVLLHMDRGEVLAAHRYLKHLGQLFTKRTFLKLHRDLLEACGRFSPDNEGLVAAAKFCPATLTQGAKPVWTIAYDVFDKLALLEKNARGGDARSEELLLSDRVLLINALLACKQWEEAIRFMDLVSRDRYSKRGSLSRLFEQVARTAAPADTVFKALRVRPRLSYLEALPPSVFGSPKGRCCSAFTPTML